MKNKLSFKKTPNQLTNFSEQDFINSADPTTDTNLILEKKKFVSFLLRLPEDIKKDLKKFSYENEINMNQICLDAIKYYLSIKSSNK